MAPTLTHLGDGSLRINHRATYGDLAHELKVERLPLIAAVREHFPQHYGQGDKVPYVGKPCLLEGDVFSSEELISLQRMIRGLSSTTVEVLPVPPAPIQAQLIAPLLPIPETVLHDEVVPIENDDASILKPLLDFGSSALISSAFGVAALSGGIALSAAFVPFFGAELAPLLGVVLLSAGAGALASVVTQMITQKDKSYVSITSTEAKTVYDFDGALIAESAAWAAFYGAMAVIALNPVAIEIALYPLALRQFSRVFLGVGDFTLKRIVTTAVLHSTLGGSSESIRQGVRFYSSKRKKQDFDFGNALESVATSAAVTAGLSLGTSLLFGWMKPGKLFYAATEEATTSAAPVVVPFQRPQVTAIKLPDPELQMPVGALRTSVNNELEVHLGGDFWRKAQERAVFRNDGSYYFLDGRLQSFDPRSLSLITAENGSQYYMPKADALSLKLAPLPSQVDVSTHVYNDDGVLLKLGDGHHLYHSVSRAVRTYNQEIAQAWAETRGLLSKSSMVDMFSDMGEMLFPPQGRGGVIINSEGLSAVPPVYIPGARVVPKVSGVLGTSSNASLPTYAARELSADYLN